MCTRPSCEPVHTIAVSVVPDSSGAPLPATASRTARAARSAASSKAFRSSAAGDRTRATGFSASIAAVLAPAPRSPNPSATASSRAPANTASWLVPRTAPWSDCAAYRIPSVPKVPRSMTCDISTSSAARWSTRKAARSRRAAVSASTCAQYARIAAAAAPASSATTSLIPASGIPIRRSQATSLALPTCVPS